MTSAWFVLRLATRSESKVLSTFHDQGIDAYIPHETRWAGPARKRFRRQVPIIPGYAFVFTSPDDFGRILDIDREAIRFMSLPDQYGQPQPAPIPPMKDAEGNPYDFAERMRMREQAGAFDYTQEHKVVWQKGDRAKVSDGHFAGWTGEIQKIKNGKDAELLIVGLWGGMSKRMTFALTELSTPDVVGQKAA